MSPLTEIHPEPVDWIVFIALPRADVYVETYARDESQAVTNAKAQLFRQCPTVPYSMLLESEAYEADDLSGSKNPCCLGEARITAIHPFPPGEW